MTELNIRAYIGVMIKGYRKKKHWTQAELACKVNAAYSTVASWEKGEREPSMQQLYVLAKLMGVSVAEFFPAMVSLSEDMVEKELMTNFRNLNEQGRTIASAAVKGLSHTAEYRREL